MEFTEGLQECLNFLLANVLTNRQTRVKNGRVLPQTRPRSARSFCHGARQWCENFIDELVFESKAQRPRKEPPPTSKELWDGKLWDWPLEN